MPHGVPIVRTVEELRRRMQPWRSQGLRTGLVPTMGALHDGHVELVAQGLRRADRIVVTIFVNPTQFGPNEDFALYPRDERADTGKLASAGAHLVFAPEPREIYSESFCTTVSVAGPAKAGLEDSFRPHFFDGVTTIVAKLFVQASCDYAMFGEKDYQQLKVVTRMALDLDVATKIIAVPTVREPDGLAMSSRNAYLSAEHRALAPLLHRSLSEAAEAIRAGTPPAKAAAEAEGKLADAGFRVDYVAARNAETLAELREPGGPVRLLAAAWLGRTRLIDNVGV
ncbi:MAG TPA: pantoate--beta-alanine ligase [Aestuariivirgaceae bacterium]|nr:pantoate--beta-alanine ligase [Aestuariivirgaceae bacterium]